MKIAVTLTVAMICNKTVTETVAKENYSPREHIICRIVFYKQDIVKPATHCVISVLRVSGGEGDPQNKKL